MIHLFEYAARDLRLLARLNSDYCRMRKGLSPSGW